MSTLRERIANYFTPVVFTRLERVELEKAACCPAEEQAPPPYPLGFFRSLTLSGIDGGLGLYCDKCKLLVRCGLEPGGTVWHCGTRHPVPRAHAGMEVHRVGHYRA
jgi:hypothetical protein